jgi:hypothetical protein
MFGDRAVLIAALSFSMVAACKKDPNLKAAKSECDAACAHATSLKIGEPDPFTKWCRSLCVDEQWTVGDTQCLADAATYEKATDCSVAAKALQGDAKGMRALADSAEAQARRAGDVEAQAKVEAGKIDDIIHQLANAKDDETRKALQQQLKDERSKQEALRRGP